MEGKHPQSGRWLRPEGVGGGRGGGIDVTFSAPKSVSIEWALGDDERRAVIEAAHSAAVEQALAYAAREHARDRQPARADVERSLEQRVEQRLIEHAATFTPSELRATVLEQSVGQLAPAQAIERAREMTASRMIVPLQGGLMTTLKLRATEQRTERKLAALARPAGRDVGDQARQYAGDRVAERIGARLTPEQSQALCTIAGPERAAILIGPAGTGKGVVIDAAAQAEQLTGHNTYGIAVAGSTAQRLGYDSPALQGKTLTLDGLVAGVEKGRLSLDRRTTVFLDEAGMARAASPSSQSSSTARARSSC